ncbi:hypothetical protein NKH71_28695 [Mesorhizobium sp. M0983]|uniref:hypothetical protein n=1 Tax=Mesorhizobium sp. M0983 TaxID=2957040 RepID=UPI0033356A40
MGQRDEQNQMVMMTCVQKMHTKVLLLFFFRFHDRVADSPFGRSSAGDITVPMLLLAEISVNLIVRRGVQFAWVLGSFRTFWVAPQPELRALTGQLGTLDSVLERI